MNQDEIIEMAKEAGLETQNGFSESVFYFAKLVAEHEREACAKVCDSFKVPAQVQGAHPDYLVGKEMAAFQLAKEIRARGQA
jgi:hypothetical protein